MKHTILLVEDELGIRETVKIFLKSQDYEVIEAENGKEGLKALQNHDIHLAVVDIMMPVMDGLTMTMKLREVSDIPVIFLTAKTEDIDKITGLNLGADDYIEKPFDILELISRVNARFRKNKNVIYNVNGFIINEDKRIISKDNQIYKLTNSEFDILLILLKEKGNIVSRDTLITTLRGNNANYESRTIDMHIKNIRKKLDDQSIIITVHGLGYRINE